VTRCLENKFVIVMQHCHCILLTYYFSIVLVFRFLLFLLRLSR